MTQQHEESDRVRHSSKIADSRIDTGPGSGSLTVQEQWVATESRRPENDGRGGNHTSLYIQPGRDDVDESRRQHQLHRDPSDWRGWNALAQWNEGVGDPNRKQQNFEADIQNWTETFASQLDCSQLQYERAKYIVEQADLGAIQSANYKTEDAILCAISLAVDSTTEYDETWTTDDWIVNQESFTALREGIGLSRDGMWAVREKLRDHCDIP